MTTEARKFSTYQEVADSMIGEIQEDVYRFVYRAQRLARLDKGAKKIMRDFFIGAPLPWVSQQQQEGFAVARSYIERTKSLNGNDPKNSERIDNLDRVGRELQKALPYRDKQLVAEGIQQAYEVYIMDGVSVDKSVPVKI